MWPEALVSLLFTADKVAYVEFIFGSTFFNLHCISKQSGSIMYEDLRKKARKKVQTKLAFFICAIVFGFTTVILLMLSLYLPSVAFWLKLPIPIFVMVLGILYIAAFGLPTDGVLSDDWKEEAIEKEMVRLYKKKKSEFSSLEEYTDEDYLELKELEMLEEKWNKDEDFV